MGSTGGDAGFTEPIPAPFCGVAMDEETMTFAEFVFKCAESKPLVAEFDRLTGSNLGLNGTGLDLMIDHATGRIAHDCEAFAGFVHEFVWMPLIGQDGNAILSKE